MNTIWRLVKKDLTRDLKNPWGTLILLTVPVVVTMLMSLVFSPRADVGKNITIHVAVFDQDDNFFTGMLRSISNQGDAAQNLRMHFVDDLESGLKLVENRKASALVVFPPNMSDDLLNDATAVISIYKNPAESILPKAIEQGIDLAAIAISQLLNLVQPEMKIAIDLFKQETMPSPLEVANIAGDTMERVAHLEPYLFPPLVTYTTVKASEYIVSASETANPIKDTDQPNE